MSSLLVLGCMWGDEAKAKIVDYLASPMDFVVRFQGGSNAGHTIVVNGKKYVFHTIPSGILYPGITCLIGSGVVIDLESLVSELAGLKKAGVEITAKRLVIDYRAALVLPLHKDLDGEHEAKLGKAKIGTTKRGIGPAYSDLAARTALRVCDLDNPAYLLTRLKQLYSYHNKRISEVAVQAEADKLLALWKKLKKYQGNVQQILHKADAQKKEILFEGAQGALLDLNFGNYPYVTSSRVMTDAVGIGTGFSARKLNTVIGIYKAYCTRVGEGPFISEIFDETSHRIRTTGNEFGSTTGRPRRIGWFDAVAGKFSAQINSVDKCAVTCLDVLSGIEELKICRAYLHKGKQWTTPQSFLEQPDTITPVYQVLVGWDADISACRSLKKLPRAARVYLEAMQDLLALQIGIVSVGKDRQQTFMIDK